MLIVLHTDTSPAQQAAIEARVRELEGERQAARDSGDAAARARAVVRFHAS